MITWKLWARVPTVALWEAVALVLEIEPRTLQPLRDGWMAGPGRGPFFEPRSFSSETKRTDFDSALSFAERAAKVAGPIYLRTGLAFGMNKRTAQVSLTEVVAFFVGVDWPGIPAPLLALVSAAAGTPTENEPVSAVGDGTPDPERRLAALRALGGKATRLHGVWNFTKTNQLTANEKAIGRPRSDQKTIHDDLVEAAEAERKEGEKPSPQSRFPT